MAEGELIVEDISKIRSPTLLYAINIIRQTDRIEKLASEITKEGSKEACLSFEAAIRSLHNLIDIRSSDQYKEEVKKIKKALRKKHLLDEGKEGRFRYYLILDKWFSLIPNEFGHFGILPPAPGAKTAGVE